MMLALRTQTPIFEYQISLTLLQWNIDKGTPNIPDFILVEC
jgi:hypothetical protein